MQQVLMYFFIGISLSMDAFSLSIAYGTNKLKKTTIAILSMFVGAFHFFMPILGSIIGTNLETFVSKSNQVVSIILSIIALQMYLSRNEDKKGNITNVFSMLLFSFSVSIDSFSVGLGLGLMKEKIIIAAILFSIVSSCFTFMGLSIGEKLSQKLGNKATYLGIIILLFLSLKYLIG